MMKMMFGGGADCAFRVEENSKQSRIQLKEKNFIIWKMCGCKSSGMAM